jgi:hypothetical protein
MVDLFNSNEMQDKGQHFVDSDVGVLDVLGTMKVTPTLFKSLTNFICIEFDELHGLVVHAITSHARSIGEAPTPFHSKPPSKQVL